VNQNINITVFEHQSLKIGNGLNEDQFSALQKHYGINGVPYYSLIHNGVKFNEHVGVLQIGNTTIEILPKAEKNDKFFLIEFLLWGLESFKKLSIMRTNNGIEFKDPFNNFINKI